jgi:putative ABC transport system permease protein
LLVWPLANLRHHPWTSALSAIAIALASFLVLSFSGFISHYQNAVDDEVEGLGYDMLITARGCPYEAATLMLRGGVGLRYMSSATLGRIETDEDIAAVFPTLIHPIRDQASEGGMLLFRGVLPASFSAQGLVFDAGEIFEEGSPGVVLGHEIAELEQLKVGDSFLIPEGITRSASSIPVRGVLARTGGQLDGSVMMSLSGLQSFFGLENKLTGVGVQLHSSSRASAQTVQDRYEEDPALQVVQLSAVVERLRMATDRMRSLVVLMSGLVAFLALSLVLTTAVLRASAEHAQVVVLHAAGLSKTFLFLAAVVENVLVVAVGLTLGGLATVFGGHFVGALLGSQLSYVPEGFRSGADLAAFSCLALVGFVFALIAALPRWLRLQRTRAYQMRGS